MMKLYLLLVTLFFSFSLFSQKNNQESENGPSDQFKRIAQDCMVSNDIKFDIKRILVPFYISKSNLLAAKTVKDLRPIYNPAWVRKFVSVTVIAVNDGKTKKAQNYSDVLSADQKKIMEQADIKSEISLIIKYIPENSLNDDSEKEINYTFIVEPENEAHYKGGKKELELYLKNNVIDKLNQKNFDRSQFMAIKFQVDSNGKVMNAEITESTNDQLSEKLLLDAIKNMPNWVPAQYKNGLKESQEFSFIVGNMESCSINLLSIIRK